MSNTSEIINDLVVKGLIESAICSFARIEVESFTGRKLTDAEANHIRNEMPKYLKIFQEEAIAFLKGDN